LTACNLYTPARTSEAAFTVEHCSGSVTYSSIGFLQENSENLSQNLLGVMQKSSNSVISTVFLEDETGNVVPVKWRRGATVGGQFTKSLGTLLDKMQQSMVHFVCCITPNTVQAAELFVPEVVNTQLRHTGMLKATRIQHEGFSYRPSFRQFMERFGLLVYGAKSGAVASKETCHKVLILSGESGWHLANTKVFLKYWLVEKLDQQARIYHHHATTLQKIGHGFIARQQICRAKDAAIFFNEISCNCANMHSCQAIGAAEDIVRMEAVPHHNSSSTRKAHVQKPDPSTYFPSPPSRLLNHTPPVGMFKFHTFCTHNWGKDKYNHERVVAIARELSALDISVWIDEQEMEGRVTATMCDGIDRSATMTVFITKEYIQKVAGEGRNGLMDNCMKEFEYAESRKHLGGSHKMIPVVMEMEMADSSRWTGPVAANLAGRLYICGWEGSAADVAKQIFANIHKLVPGLELVKNEDEQQAPDAGAVATSLPFCDDVFDCVASVDLSGKVERQLVAFGVSSLSDLLMCTVEDLLLCGVKGIHAKKLLAAAAKKQRKIKVEEQLTKEKKLREEKAERKRVKMEEDRVHYLAARVASLARKEEADIAQKQHEQAEAERVRKMREKRQEDRRKELEYQCQQEAARKAARKAAQERIQNQREAELERRRKQRKEEVERKMKEDLQQKRKLEQENWPRRVEQHKLFPESVIVSGAGEDSVNGTYRLECGYYAKVDMSRTSIMLPKIFFLREQKQSWTGKYRGRWIFQGGGTERKELYDKPEKPSASRTAESTALPLSGYCVKNGAKGPAPTIFPRPISPPAFLGNDGAFGT